MRTRLDDLIATADRQLASRSYDAAIDTYRTALGEPGAAEADIEERLEAACRTRDEARGIVRPVEPPAPPKVETAEPPEEPPADLRMEPKPSLTALSGIDPEQAPAGPRMDPEPVPAAVVDDRPIEPPSFHLIEDDPSMLERFGPEQYRPLEAEKLSILDPTPPLPETPDESQLGTRILLAVGIFMVVCFIVFLLK